MGQMTKSRKHRLRACVNVLKDNAEGFVKVGLALIEINESRLFEEEGFTDLESYLKANKHLFGFASATHAYRIMKAASYRGYLPDPASDQAGHSWTESSMRQLTRLDTPEKAAKVAEKVLREVARDGVKLTAPLVRKYVDVRLGTKPKKDHVPITDIFDGLLGSLEGITELVNGIPEDAIDLFKRKRKSRAKELAAVITGVEKSLERIWALLP